jgi:hypothetical protein
MKPSEINARLVEINAVANPIREQIAALRVEAKTLESQPAGEDGKKLDNSARMAAIAASVAALEDQLKPHDVESESLRTREGEIVDAYGVKIRQIRASKKLSADQFVAWRNWILTLPEDDRMTAIDAKMKECGL